MPANSIQGILEALRGYRRPMRDDPFHGTAHLTDGIAPSCHERPPGGLWRRAGPRDANLGALCGLFGAWRRGVGPGRRVGVVCGNIRKHAGGGTPTGGFAFHPPPHLRRGRPASQSMLHRDRNSARSVRGGPAAG